MAERIEEFVKNVITPIGVAQYPSLNTPDTRFDEGGTYKCNLILPADSQDTKKLIEAVDELYAAKMNQLEDILSPAKFKKAIQIMRVPYEIEEDDNGEETGNIIFKAKSKASFVSKKTGDVIERKLDMVDAKKHPLKANVGGGSSLRMSVQLRTYYVAALGMGVSARLEAVQVTDLVEFSSKKAATVFSETEGFDQGESEDTVGSGVDEVPFTTTASAADL